MGEKWYQDPGTYEYALLLGAYKTDPKINDGTLFNQLICR
jgi:hypothetical protein